MKTNLKHITQAGFTTPKHYFNDLEIDLLGIAKTEALKVKTSGFEVEDHYFDALEEKILNKFLKEKQTKVIPIFSKKNLIYLSGIAAAILISFSIYISKPEITFDTIDINLVENYLFEANITSEEMATLFAEDFLIEDEFIQNNLTEESIEIYILNDDNIDDFLIE